MFVHQNRLQHLLTPKEYLSEAQHRLEVEQLFQPAWHCVGTTAELSKHGDFLTLDLFDRPLLVRNLDGEIHAFLNVCAHRHCLLTHEPRGSDPHFRCQYHGWEYTKEGKTSRIPEANAFRPFDRANAILRKFRVATCGQLIFVSLSEDGPGLSEFLGPYYTTCADSFAPPFRQLWRWEADYAANWKVPIENSLESYHIDCLHKKSIKNTPAEENCGHDLDERWTTFRTVEIGSLTNKVQGWVVRRLGLTPTNIYTHHHVHPHLTFASMDVFRMVQMVVPTSPTTSRHFAWTYSIHGPRTGLLARGLAWMMARIVKMVSGQILREDANIFGDVQRGLQASEHRGVIGTREERIFVFQKYVLDRCGASNGQQHANPLAISPSG
jgi:phenylpropionate dioxygenase-like ring-hydroxylating dioxygenase large terminal subunit